MSIKVSVIIPVYKVEKYIERCVISLFTQTMREGIEFIFVNDHTPDKSIEIIKGILNRFPCRKSQVLFVEHSVNSGIAKTRMSGLAESRGEYIIYCDSDDWVESSIYETMYALAKQNNSDIVVCDYFISYAKHEAIVKQNINKDKEHFVRQLLRGDIHNNVWNKLIRKTLYDSLSPIYVEGVNMWEDVGVVSRLAYGAKIVSHLQIPLYHYSQDNSNAYTRRWKACYTNNILKVVDLNRDFFIDKCVDYSPLVQRAIYSILSHVCVKERQRIMRTYQEEILSRKIDYSLFSTYGKILAWSLFNSHNRLADVLIKIKSKLLS